MGTNAGDLGSDFAYEPPNTEDEITVQDLDDVDYPSLSSESAFATAEENGWKVVLPKKDELFIDIDDEFGATKFDELFPIFARFLPDAVVTRRTPSPSGKPGHYHIVVNVQYKLDACERVALQAILGSDRKRELFAMHRISVNDKNPTLFYEKKEQSDV